MSRVDQATKDSVAARVRAAGIPDFANRWATLSVEQVNASLERAASTVALAQDRRIEMPRTLGPKEQQLRSLKASRPLTTPKAPAPAKPRPASAGKKEPTMDLNTDVTNATTDNPSATSPTPKKEKSAVRTTKSKSKSKTKSAKKPGARKVAAKAKKATPAKKVASKSKAPNGELREGTKLAAIVGLLRRPAGCTTKQVLAATGWPSVSMPQQAKAAGLKLAKEKVDGITVYRAA